jgi:hypothetical protein
VVVNGDVSLYVARTSIAAVLDAAAAQSAASFAYVPRSRVLSPPAAALGALGLAFAQPPALGHLVSSTLLLHLHRTDCAGA